MIDPKKQPAEFANLAGTSLDILQSILRDCPKSGIHIQADAARNLADALKAMAQGMQHVESLTLRVQMRKSAA